jgi:hypothetical protein
MSMGPKRVKWKQRLNAGFESVEGETPERDIRCVDDLRKFREPPTPKAAAGARSGLAKISCAATRAAPTGLARGEPGSARPRIRRSTRSSSAKRTRIPGPAVKLESGRSDLAPEARPAPGAGANNLGQAIVDLAGLTKADNSGSFADGASLCSGGVGQALAAPDAPPLLNRRHPISAIALDDESRTLRGEAWNQGGSLRAERGALQRRLSP